MPAKGALLGGNAMPEERLMYTGQASSDLVLLMAAE